MCDISDFGDYLRFCTFIFLHFHRGLAIGTSEELSVHFTYKTPQLKFGQQSKTMASSTPSGVNKLCYSVYYIVVFCFIFFMYLRFLAYFYVLGSTCYICSFCTIVRSSFTLLLLCFNYYTTTRSTLLLGQHSSDGP
jgi:hypothetical protein